MCSKANNSSENSVTYKAMLCNITKPLKARRVNLVRYRIKFSETEMKRYQAALLSGMGSHIAMLGYPFAEKFMFNVGKYFFN